MLKKIYQVLTGDPDAKRVKKMQPIVTEINRIEESYQKISETELKGKTAEFKNRIEEYLRPFKEEYATAKAHLESPEVWNDPELKKLAQGELADKKRELVRRTQIITTEILPEAFATVKNACRRLVGQKVLVKGKELTWDMIPFDVQLIGGMVLHDGAIAEMKTGEGKTLVATLPMYLNALTGLGAHLVTVNEYLATRDAEWMGHLYNYLGLSVGVVLNNQSYDQKRAAYASDIVYGTNNEFGFDYLRDNMATDPTAIVQGNLSFVIIDEVDSILVDEARTPLIISAPGEESSDKYRKYAQLVKQLERDVDYAVDEKMKAATLTEGGIHRMEQLLGMKNIYTEAGFVEVHHIEQSLKAYALFKKDVDYVVRDGEVLIVDEFTGRILPGRRYSKGLHQAIEAKEGLEVKRESRTWASITFQNFFRLYDKMAGMTGTAKTEEEEFRKIYGLDVVVIPTNKTVRRTDRSDVIYKTELAKFRAVAQIAKERQKLGQPVLIGTIAIEKSEFLSTLLMQQGVKHEVLNAKQHAREAEIIAQAGERGAVTIATNMAGRGTDIKITKEVEELGGLCVLGTERHESRRIDNQLRGRSGRQGDRGESQFFVSTEDDLMRIFGGDRIKKMMELLKMPEDMPIENKMISNSIESAQKKVEGFHFDARKHVVEYDDVMNKHREIIYSRRRRILQRETLAEDIQELLREVITGMVTRHTAGHPATEWNWDELLKEVHELTPTGLSADDLRAAGGSEAVVDALFAAAQQAYQRRETLVPDPNIFRQLEKQVYLRSIDVLWMEHLENMEDLRDAVSMRGYAQKDPLIEYKREGYELFMSMLKKIEFNTVNTLFKIEFTVTEPPVVKVEKPAALTTNEDEIEGVLAESDMTLEQNKPSKTVTNKPVVKSVDAVGRNEECPCGSGKKYKKCCGRGN